jgi:hypothetical protein
MKFTATSAPGVRSILVSDADIVAHEGSYGENTAWPPGTVVPPPSRQLRRGQAAHCLHDAGSLGGRGRERRPGERAVGARPRLHQRHDEDEQRGRIERLVVRPNPLDTRCDQNLR